MCANAGISSRLKVSNRSAAIGGDPLPRSRPRCDDRFCCCTPRVRSTYIRASENRENAIKQTQHSHGPAKACWMRNAFTTRTTMLPPRSITLVPESGRNNNIIENTYDGQQVFDDVLMVPILNRPFRLVKLNARLLMFPGHIESGQILYVMVHRYKCIRVEIHFPKAIRYYSMSNHWYFFTFFLIFFFWFSYIH